MIFSRVIFSGRTSPETKSVTTTNRAPTARNRRTPTYSIIEKPQPERTLFQPIPGACKVAPASVATAEKKSFDFSRFRAFPPAARHTGAYYSGAPWAQQPENRFETPEVPRTEQKSHGDEPGKERKGAKGQRRKENPKADPPLRFCVLCVSIRPRFRYEVLFAFSSFTSASAYSRVVAFPPRSAVRTSPRFNTANTAFRTRSAALSSPR